MEEGFEMYRQSAVGKALTETLEDMVCRGSLTPELAFTVLLQFDKSMTHAMECQVKSRATFKGGHLHTYRHCDDVWTLILRNTTFKNEDTETLLRKVKIVACDMRLLKKPPPEEPPVTCHHCQP